MKRGNILAHRGYHCSKASEKNSPESLFLALEKGFGIETDLRDFKGEVYISHDPVIEPKLSLNAFLEMAKQFLYLKSKIAFNIKSDGLADMISEMIKVALGEDNTSVYFFDASVPDSLSYLRKGLPVYTRLSEHETTASFENLSSGVWIDNFDGSFDQLKAASRVLSKENNCSIVSPELHGRDYLPLWKNLKESNLVDHSLFQICTDFPDEAAEYFSN